MLGLIAAAVLSILFFFNIIPFLFNIIIIAFYLVLITFLVLLVLTIVALVINDEDLRKCLCCYGTGLLIAILLTLIVAILAFTLCITPWSILSAIIMFFLILFIIILLYYFVSLIGCIINTLCPPCMPPR